MTKDDRKQPSLQTSFSLVIFLVFIVLTVFLSAILYSSVEENIICQFEEKMDQTEISVTHSAILADKGLILYEKAYDQQLKDAFVPFLEAYEQSGGNPATIDLDALKNRMKQSSDWEIDLYIINESGVIEYTTFEPDRGFDFSTIPGFYSSITTVREGDEFSADRVSTSFSDPDVGKKYAYMPTPDHRYLLEVSFTSESFMAERKNFPYTAISDMLIEDGSALREVSIFDVTYRRLAGHGASAQGDTLAHVKQVYADHFGFDITDKPNETITRYIYIDLNNAGYPSSSQMNLVGEIVFTTQPLQDSLNMLRFNVFVLSLLGVGIGVFFAYYISYFLIRPVKAIMSDIDYIAEGHLDHPIQEARSAETEKLRRSVNILVVRLKSDILMLKQTSAELDSELKRTQEAEKALMNGNIKLGLLSGITRHDILNQIQALTMISALLKEELGDEAKAEQPLRIMDDVIATMEEQITFTQEYEMLGSKTTEWMNIWSLVTEVAEGTAFRQITTEISTGNLEVFADPLLRRVIFNLFDNAVRHGEGVTKMTVSFHEEGDGGLLIFEDDGCGVEESMKEKIFWKKTGKNTGYGLFLVQEILSITGMTIRETGKEGVGARFDIWVPEECYRFKE
ncbi:HAMP domain-containing sensor histidine kinase [Methanogenium sp. MK-MG]|uniref:sensor histidine kinase n=1 Tax=Methanogenium sp. MK-MG TaxID=2599926 RepID=UPI0013EA3D2F|nr:HAMP domain-containing sensor histidine kinase [Methanogenium sp. MK-MG]KAF1078313.1 Adaptive-response sensory-kinase SasA [Methanogenium sp. MK-MG]